MSVRAPVHAAAPSGGRPPRARGAVLPLAAAVLALLGLASLVSAQEPAPTLEEALGVVEVWLEAQRAYERIPGVSAAVVHDQETVWSGAYGLAHREEGVPATPETLYSICSISKLFTSVALMQLRDRGLVALSDPVAEHLPWYAVRPGDTAAAPVTVEGLLTHASGLPRESDHPYWSGPDFAFPTREEVISGLENQATLYPAWARFQYSNLGMTLAGELVRELSGEPYDRYVRRWVLDPLGLDDTWPDMPAEHRGGRLATGYSAPTREGERYALPFYQARGIAPAAGYASTVGDLAEFAKWTFRMEGDGEEVLHAHTLAEMQRVRYVDPGWDTFWGLGFSISRRNDETFTGHGGSCPGYRTQLLLQPDDEIGVVFMANAGGVGTGTFVNGVYDLVAPPLKARAGKPEGPAAAAAEAPSPGPSRSAATPAPPVADYLGTYDAQPWGGETAVVRWKGSVALLGLPTDNPARALSLLRHVEGDTFRRVLDGGDALGEAVAFERDARGRVVAFVRFENRYPRIP